MPLKWRRKKKRKSKGRRNKNTEKKKLISLSIKKRKLRNKTGDRAEPRGGGVRRDSRKKNSCLSI